MTKDGSSRCLQCSVSATDGASRGVEEEDEAPVRDPEYGDLLDSRWLEPGTDALDLDDELVDIGLTIDLDEAEDAEELAQMMDLDVGTLLTSLPDPELEALDVAELVEGGAGDGSLQELLLPEEASGHHREEDDEVGNDERFPVFEGAASRSSVLLDDDAEGPHEGEELD